MSLSSHDRDCQSRRDAQLNRLAAHRLTQSIAAKYRTDPSELRSIVREVLAVELAGAVEAHVDRIIGAELPALVEAIVGNLLTRRNGQWPVRR